MTRSLSVLTAALIVGIVSIGLAVRRGELVTIRFGVLRLARVLAITPTLGVVAASINSIVGIAGTTPSTVGVGVVEDSIPSTPLIIITVHPLGGTVIFTTT